MFDAQRQGRLSFYMTSHGEEGTCVGSASALEKEDVVFCQYREAGVFMQRGYTFDEFMGQLFANVKDEGRGRNMPVHYGSKALNIVWLSCPFLGEVFTVLAFGILTARDANPTRLGGRIRAQDAASRKP